MVWIKDGLRVVNFAASTPESRNCIDHNDTSTTTADRKNTSLPNCNNGSAALLPFLSQPCLRNLNYLPRCSPKTRPPTPSTTSKPATHPAPARLDQRSQIPPQRPCRSSKTQKGTQHIPRARPKECSAIQSSRRYAVRPLSQPVPRPLPILLANKMCCTDTSAPPKSAAPPPPPNTNSTSASAPPKTAP